MRMVSAFLKTSANIACHLAGLGRSTTPASGGRHLRPQGCACAEGFGRTRRRGSRGRVPARDRRSRHPPQGDERVAHRLGPLLPDLPATFGGRALSCPGADAFCPIRSPQRALYRRIPGWTSGVIAHPPGCTGLLKRTRPRTPPCPRVVAGTMRLAPCHLRRSELPGHHPESRRRIGRYLRAFNVAYGAGSHRNPSRRCRRTTAPACRVAPADAGEPRISLTPLRHRRSSGLCPD